ncbi:MAG: hypothetical protein AABZ47_10965 [Planctomycetota bacterium]
MAVGILLLMLSLAGQVMSLTVQSTGQAKAVSEVNQYLRFFEQSVREDLRHVRPGESVLFIQGNPINTYWTDLGRQADNNREPGDGYPFPKDVDRIVAASGLPEKPRADILMIFSCYKATSFHDPKVTSQMQQVVYGHADLGEYVPDGADGFRFEMGPDAFPDDLNLPSAVPAEHWHLARRSILLIPNAPPPGGGLPPWENQAMNNPTLSADPVISKRIGFCWAMWISWRILTTKRKCLFPPVRRIPPAGNLGISRMFSNSISTTSGRNLSKEASLIRRRRREWPIDWVIIFSRTVPRSK